MGTSAVAFRGNAASPRAAESRPLPSEPRRSAPDARVLLVFPWQLGSEVELTVQCEGEAITVRLREPDATRPSTPRWADERPSPSPGAKTLVPSCRPSWHRPDLSVAAKAPSSRSLLLPQRSLVLPPPLPSPIQPPPTATKPHGQHSMPLPSLPSPLAPPPRGTAPCGTALTAGEAQPSTQAHSPSAAPDGDAAVEARLETQNAVGSAVQR